MTSLGDHSHTMKLRNQSSLLSDDGDFLLAMEVVTGPMLPIAMEAAVELGVLETIREASPRKLSSSEIASQLPANNNREAPLVLDRILRLLASHSFLTCDLVHGSRVYGLAPASRFFLPNEDGVSLAPSLLLFRNKALAESGYHLKAGVLDGVLPLSNAHDGKHLFEFAADETRLMKLFNQSMNDQTVIAMKKILEIYKGFEGLSQLVDVAGGLGANLSLIVSKYPQIMGTNYDLPDVVSAAPSYPGVKHVGGDMFLKVPQGQAIFMKHILHDWGDDECLKILKNCYDALPETGKVILVESLLPELPEDDFLSQTVSRLDLYMYNVLPGAKERTKEELQALAARAGFGACEVVCRVYSFWVLELYKTLAPI